MQVIKRLVNWARASSLWAVHLVTGCCSPEEMALFTSRFDVERLGVLMIAESPRQADILIVTGLITRKMAERVKRVYEQIPEPKYVVAMGDCAISGGLFWDSYNVVKGVDRILPVDVYIPGCPPRPEAVIHGLRLLQEKIKKER